MDRPTHSDRLRDQIRALREEAAQLPPGVEREDLLNRVKQEEIALRLIEWITSVDELAPPSDVIPITMHRLRRK